MYCRRVYSGGRNPCLSSCNVSAVIFPPYNGCDKDDKDIKMGERGGGGLGTSSFYQYPSPAICLHTSVRLAQSTARSSSHSGVALKSSRGSPQVIHGGPQVIQGWPSSHPWVALKSSRVALQSSRGGPPVIQGWPSSHPGVALKSSMGGPQVIQGWPSSHPWVALKSSRGGPQVIQWWPSSHPGPAF